VAAIKERGSLFQALEGTMSAARFRMLISGYGRHFWRNMLPRLKYYNPAVKMIVSRPAESGGECVMRVYVKQAKSGSSVSSPAEPQPETIKAPFKPVEFDEHFVAETSVPVPPPNKSFDEQIIEIPMKGKEDLHIWQQFISKIPITSVEHGLGEVETVKELQKGKEERSDKLEEDDSKKWLEMFKKEQIKVREMEEKHVGQFAAMKAKVDAQKKEFTESVLSA
jgi:large subunit ribosomal protein MRP49